MAKSLPYDTVFQTKDNMTTLTTLLRAAALAAIAIIAVPAFAQYVWTDAQGHKQYSDMPPPSSVPRSRILKQPGGTSAAPEAPASADLATPNADAVVKSTAAMTTAEREVDFKKRMSEQAAKDKKTAEATRRAAEKTENCEKMQGYNRALEDGVRISTTDKNGERAYLTDEQRAAELQKNQRAVRDCNR